MAQDSLATERVADEAFERALLTSARLDAPPEGATKLALARFALAAASMTALEPKSLASPGRMLRSAAKWLAIGMLVGGAVVAAYVLGTKHNLTPAPNFSRPANFPSASVTAASPAASAAREQYDPSPTSQSKVSQPAELNAPHRGAKLTLRTQRPTLAVASAAASASLAEEVARLDAARTALAIGDFKTVSSVLERYTLDFPHGVLAREADVVAISALSESGESAEALNRARRFLSNYPHDLHAARVKQLVSWQDRTVGEQ